MSDYVFQEWPKWVTVGENEPVLCQTKDDELALTSEPVEAVISEKPKRGRPAKVD